MPRFEIRITQKGFRYTCFCFLYRIRLLQIIAESLLFIINIWEQWNTHLRNLSHGNLTMLKTMRARLGNEHSRMIVQKEARVMMAVTRNWWHSCIVPDCVGWGVNDGASSPIFSSVHGIGAGPYIVSNITMIENKLKVNITVHTTPGMQQRRLCVHPRPYWRTFFAPKALPKKEYINRGNSKY